MQIMMNTAKDGWVEAGRRIYVYKLGHCDIIIMKLAAATEN